MVAVVVSSSNGSSSRSIGSGGVEVIAAAWNLS